MDDLFGYSVSCGSVESLAVLNDYLHREINHIEFNLEEANRVQDCTLLKILLAERTMWRDSTQACSLAKPYLEEAKCMPMGDRERLWFDAVEAWVDNRDDDQISAYVRLIEAYPKDSAAAKQGIYNCMRQGKQPTMLKFVEAMLQVEENQNSSEALSFISFACIENFRLEEGMELATKSFEIDPTNSWAQHNIAHVHASHDRFEEAREILKGRSDTWQNGFIYTHCSWHYGLYNLLLEDADEAMRIFNQNIVGVGFWHFLNRFHMLSFLMYLDVLGEDVVPLFPERLITEMLTAEKWSRDRLVDLLAVWGLQKTGHIAEAQELCKLGDLGEVWEVGVRVMTFLNSGERSAAAHELEPILKQTCLFGSSFQKRHTISDCCLLTRRNHLEQLRRKRFEARAKALTI